MIRKASEKINRKTPVIEQELRPFDLRQSSQRGKNVGKLIEPVFRYGREGYKGLQGKLGRAAEQG